MEFATIAGGAMVRRVANKAHAPMRIDYSRITDFEALMLERANLANKSHLKLIDLLLNVTGELAEEVTGLSCELIERRL